ncbi:Calmodulin-binding transcription activator 3 [Zea mays]|uniref:Calmodulin-binding transcription activator 3 n=1 Tax=Zea mays TaxID=4577 RepID=A0A3L6DPW7_MAIZE|nr:Calmodulin-binding transcription activator 3 [Zea mays]PWZ53328.1 Calmodulin-binding transcription activator 3 [Zea mays]PWZ54304.1 Calmodulin-binding transcription activator 3 [Zea mays]
MGNKQLDAYVVNPSLSQDQLFSILDVSPSCAYIGTNTKVSVTGTFLVNKEHVESHRVACSEVREFEYRDSEAHYMETSHSQANGVNEMHLHIRLDKLLTLGQMTIKCLFINSLILDGKWSNQESSVKEVVSTARVQSLKKLVKEKLHQWLICKVNDDGKGPNVLCKEGQGVIHLVAALGYDWAIRPIIIVGVNVNFRDAHGWTALHWAASLGSYYLALQDFADQKVQEGGLPEDEKEKFKEFLKEKVRERKRELKQAKEARRKAIDDMDPKGKG